MDSSSSSKSLPVPRVDSDRARGGMTPGGGAGSRGCSAVPDRLSMVGPLDLCADRLGRVTPMAPSTAALRPLERSRLYEDVGQRLGEFVRESRMEPGDQFPPERDLARQLQVSRTSVRQA